ncbi:MAG: hypothetical protein AB8B54_00635 [Sphingorhabdus sp.]
MSETKFSRRDMLGATAAVGTGLVLTGCSESQASANATPAQIEGPFYPIADQADKDADLTMLKGSDKIAVGEVIFVEGKILDDDGLPIADAVVDIWQANAAGRYAHEADTSSTPVDPNFQGWAIMKTKGDGSYRFKTVKPGPYPVQRGWVRPPHIHFKISRRGYRELTTQMYFDAEPLNKIDQILGEIPKEQQSRVIAKREDDSAPFLFNVVLAKI